MKILPLVKGIQNDVTQSSIRLKQAAYSGYSIADRTSRIYKQGNLKKYLNVVRIVTSKIASGTTKEEIPYLAGAIGMFLPLPLTSPIFLLIGTIIRFSLPDDCFEQDNKNNLDVNA